MSDELTYVSWDVQHGHASYFGMPNGNHTVIDLGTGSYGGSGSFSPLKHLQNKYGVDRLDHVIVTHPHKDHIDDILNFEDLNPRVFTRPKHLAREDIMEDVREEDEALFDKYFKINDRYDTPVSSEDSPKNPSNTGGASIQTFHPTECGSSNINNHSIVTVVEYLGVKFLIPGDNEPPSWKELLEDESFVEAIRGTDIFLASHHGRESGYHADLFDHFTPKLVIVSDGRFGDTSATDRYSDVAEGWTVHSRSGGSSKRYCVTTRQDGVITVKVGTGTEDKTYLEVTID